MHSRIQITGAARGLILVALLLLWGCGGKDGKGEKAPDFHLQDLSGSVVSLRQFSGKTVIVDFWATWCPPCRMSIPELVDLQDRYREKGLVVIGISLDDPRQVNNRDLSVFKETNKINYAVVRGNEAVLRAYGGADGMAIPTMFVIDGQGRIVEKYVGFAPGRVEKSLKRILG